MPMSDDSTQAPPPAPDIINRLQAGVPPALALLAGMQLDVFTVLADRSVTAAEAAAALGVAEDRLARLLYALTLTGLVRHDEGRFSNAPEAAAWLVRGRPGYLGGTHELIGDIWLADMQTARSVRSGTPAALHDFDAMDDAALAAFLRGLAPFAAATGKELAETFDFARCTSVIDIGGGSGAVLAALLGRHPQLSGTILELPRVAAVAATLFAGEPWFDRVTIEPGNIVEHPSAALHDAAILRALVQVLSPEQARRAIANTFRSLRPGGMIHITGSGIVDDTRLAPAASVYLNLTLMNFYRSGESYTLAQHSEWLTAAGFVDPRHRLLSGGSFIITAQKPGA
jgi:hypothetical protein